MPSKSFRKMIMHVDNRSEQKPKNCPVYQELEYGIMKCILTLAIDHCVDAVDFPFPSLHYLKNLSRTLKYYDSLRYEAKG